MAATQSVALLEANVHPPDRRAVPAKASEVCRTETGALSADDAKLHDSLTAACDALYTEGSGTLQLAVAAMCSLQVDVVFDTLAGDVE